MSRKRRHTTFVNVTRVQRCALPSATVGSNIYAVTGIGKVLSVLLAALGMRMFPIFTVYITNVMEDTLKKDKKEEEQAASDVAKAAANAAKEAAKAAQNAANVAATESNSSSSDVAASAAMNAASAAKTAADAASKIVEKSSAQEDNSSTKE